MPRDRDTQTHIDQGQRGRVEEQRQTQRQGEASKRHQRHRDREQRDRRDSSTGDTGRERLTEAERYERHTET